MTRSLPDEVMIHVFPTLEDLEAQIDANEMALDRLLSNDASHLSESSRIILISQIRQELHDQKCHRLFRLFQ